MAATDRTQAQQGKDPADVGSDGPRTARKIRWKEPSVLIGVIGTVIALLAFGRDLFGFEIAFGTRQAPTAEVATSVPFKPADPVPRTSPTVSPVPPPAVAPSGVPLTGLNPMAGGSFLKRVPGTTTFTIACATNRDGDMYRAVQFAIPRRNAANFSGRVGPDEIVDDIGVDVRVDNLIKARVTLQPDQGPSPLTAEIAGGSTLELRLTCSRPGGAVTFSEAVLTN